MQSNISAYFCGTATYKHSPPAERIVKIKIWHLRCCSWNNSLLLDSFCLKISTVFLQSTAVSGVTMNLEQGFMFYRKALSHIWIVKMTIHLNHHITGSATEFMLFCQLGGSVLEDPTVMVSAIIHISSMFSYHVMMYIFPHWKIRLVVSILLLHIRLIWTGHSIFSLSSCATMYCLMYNCINLF